MCSSHSGQLGNNRDLESILEFFSIQGGKKQTSLIKQPKPNGGVQSDQWQRCSGGRWARVSGGLHALQFLLKLEITVFPCLPGRKGFQSTVLL